LQIIKQINMMVSGDRGS